MLFLLVESFQGTMVITAVNYLRSTTVLPIAVPMGTVALELLLYPFGVGLPKWIQEPLSVAMAALLYFGVPYVVLMSSLLWLLRRASLSAHVWLALSAPLLMAFVVTPAFIWALGIRGPELGESWRLYAELCLKVGFAYVALALGSLVLGLKTGVLQRESP